MGNGIELKSMPAFQELGRAVNFNCEGLKEDKLKQKVSTLIEKYNENRKYALSADFANLVSDASDNVIELESEEENSQKFSRFQKALAKEIKTWQSTTKPSLKKKIEECEKTINEIKDKAKSQKSSKIKTEDKIECDVPTLKEMKKALKEVKADLKSSNAQLSKFRAEVASIKEDSASMGVMTMKTLGNALDNGKSGDKAGGVLRCLLETRTFLLNHSSNNGEISSDNLDVNEIDKEIDRLTSLNEKKGVQKSLSKIKSAATFAGSTALPNIYNIKNIKSVAEKFYDDTLKKLTSSAKSGKKSLKDIWKTLKLIKKSAKGKFNPQLEQLYSVCIGKDVNDEQRAEAKNMVATLFSLCIINAASAGGIFTTIIIGIAIILFAALFMSAILACCS